MAVEFLTVLYGSGAELDDLIFLFTDLVWEVMYLWMEECQGRFRKLSISLAVSMVLRLRSSYLTSLNLEGNSLASL